MENVEPGELHDPRLRELTEWLPHLVFTALPDGRVDYVNRRWLEYTGMSEAAALGFGWLTVIHPDDRDEARRAWDEGVRTSQGCRTEHRLRRADGAYRWFETRLAPVVLEGVVVLWIGSETESHGEHGLRARLTEEHDRFVDLTGSVPGVLSSLVRQGDGPTSTVFVSGPFSEMFGEGMIGPGNDHTGFRNRIHPDDRPRLFASLPADPPDGARWQGAFRYAHPSRGERWFEIIGTARRLADGTTRWACVTLDITERKRAELALLRIQERFARAFDHNPVAMVFTGLPDDHTLDVNQALVDLSGYSREELLAHSPGELGLFGPRARIADRCEGLRAVQAELVTKDGQVRDVLLSSERLALEDRPAILTLTLDVTDRARAERRLAMQNAVGSLLSAATSLADAAPALLRELCEVEGAACGALWLVDAEQGQLRVVGIHATPALADSAFIADTRTRRFGRGVGLPGRAWDTGRPLTISMEAVTTEQFPRREVALAAGLRFAMVFPVVAADRVLGVIELNSPHGGVRDPQLEHACEAVGRQIGMFIERTRAHEAIAQSEARLQSVIESMTEGLVIASPEGKILHWNPAALAIHGFTNSADWEHELPHLGEIFELATLDGDVLGVDQWPVSRIIGGEKLHDVELRVRRRDAAWEKIIAHGGSRVRQVDGSDLIVVSLADVTPRVRLTEAAQRLNTTLEERVAERTAALEQANEELEAFTYSVSHDLRAPLRAVNGFADILLQDHEHELSPEARRLATTIRASGERMASLITDLLALSRFGRMALRRRPLDMEALVREALADIGAQEDLARYQISIAPLPVAEGDASLIKQVWINLLSNAIKYSRLRATPVIEVSVEDAPGGPIYVVRDNGTGFSMTDAHRLFGLFQRLHSAEQYEGTGVGLALVQRLVHRHGGQVWAESELDHGATFRFTLPRRTP